MSKYFITGAAGFIGSRVANQLLSQGDEVIAVDNLNDAYDPRLKFHRLDALRVHPKFFFQQIDICDRQSLQELVKKHTVNSNFSAIINLAARAGVPISVENPWLYLDTNTTGTLNLLDLAQQYQIPKFVLASTSSLYGSQNSLPYNENANTDRPLSPYAASKKGAEALAYTYHHLYGLDVTILRYFTVYGPAGRPDMSIFRFVHWIESGVPIQLTGDGSQSRDFTYVDDIARGTVLATRPLGYEIINLGSDHPYTLNEMIALIETYSGKSAKIHNFPTPHTDINATWADINKAGSLLDWQPQVSFEDGIGRLVTWYRENHELASTINFPQLFKEERQTK